MRLTTLTALLLPLLLSSVLAAPTSTGHENASNGALKVRQSDCGPDMTVEECNKATAGCSDYYDAENNCSLEDQQLSFDAEEGEK